MEGGRVHRCCLDKIVGVDLAFTKWITWRLETYSSALNRAGLEQHTADSSMVKINKLEAENFEVAIIQR